MRAQLLILVFVMGIGFAGCAAKTDYTQYRQHMPKAILVLPPINHSAELKASEAFMATVTVPIAENGYYVFPIAIVDRYMKENGLPTPGDMHRVQVGKLREVFGADAILYVEILDWKTQYLIIDSSTMVRLKYRLVDAHTGTSLWEREGAFTRSSSAGQSNLIGMVASAAMHAAMNDKIKRDVGAYCNTEAVRNSDHGMLLGFRHPKFASQMGQ